MTDYFAKPEHWRMRADMTRTIALGMTGGGKDILLQIANDYDKMALRMESEIRAMRRDPPKPVPIRKMVKVIPQDRLVELQQKWNRK